jgi:hypothetical protein
MKNKVINSNYKLTKLFSLILNTNPQVLCLWKIRTSSRIPTTPFVVHLVTKLISALRIGLEIIPLFV